MQMLCQTQSHHFFAVVSDLLHSHEATCVDVAQAEHVIVSLFKSAAYHTFQMILGKLDFKERLGVKVFYITFFAFVLPKKDFGKTISSEILVIRGHKTSQF
jgi:hypothetical protein